MDIAAIVAELKKQRDRLTDAINALGASGGAGKRSGPKPGRHMSAAARARISAAQKARWAKQKKAA